MNSKGIFLLLLLSLSHIVSGQQALADLAFKPGEKLFVGVVENRKALIEKLQQERTEFIKKKTQRDQEVKTYAEELRAQITRISDQVKAKKEDEFLKKKLVLLNESYQVCKDIQRDGDKVLTVVDEYIESLRSFLDDSNFAIFKRDQKLSERLFYSFEDLQRLNGLILDQEKKVSLLSDQEKHLSAERDNRKRALQATQEAYKVKKEQIESGKLAGGVELDNQQTKELITLEEQLYKYKKILDGLHIQELDYKTGLVSLQLSIAKSHLAIYKDYLRTIKPAVRVTEADIVHAREQLAQATNKYRGAKEKLRTEIDRIIIFKDKTEKDLQELTAHFGVSLSKEIDEWSKEPPQSASGFLAYCEVGALHEQLRTYQRKQQLLDVYVELEDEKLKEDSLALQVKETYHKKFTTEEEITQELKKYDAPHAESTAGISRYKEKINTIADQLNIQKQTLENIQTLRQTILKQRETVFKSHGAEYNRCLGLLKRAEAFEREQIDILSKLTGAYSGLTSVINNKLRLINFIISELESRTIWHRPEYAITWDGVKNIVPDIINFLTYIRTYFTRVSFVAFFARITEAMQAPMHVLFLLIKIILLAIFVIMIRRIIPSLHRFIMQSLIPGIKQFRLSRETAHAGFIQRLVLLFAQQLVMWVGGVVGFIQNHFMSIGVWLFTYFSIMFLDMNDTYLYIIFYLFSIPYLLYLMSRLISFLMQFNKEHEYALLAEDFQRRFFVVIGFLLYATVVIQCFREAFMLAHYYRSELPTILFALNIIILQISLILLIDKEQILGLIPTYSDVWKVIHDFVSRYYYLIFLVAITIIVMSNPYVGFGRLVLYLLFGMLYSVALFFILYWLHGLFKRGASRMYFINIDDVARERFTNAKTWFGITIISSFIVLTFLGVVIGARIWGWPITLGRMQDFFYYPIIGADTEQQITLVSFSKILAFVFLGIMISYAVNRFVLDRIFDLLLVDSGVQHTVTSITQYFIIIVAIFLGFHIAQLGALINYIVIALIVGLGWVLKEPIGDFVAYFIILVQRPVKIGDYIKVSNNIQGVVRKITARAVILRRKNSITLVVPNSFLIAQTITNWNYTRNFIAFDDIILHVDYGEDPEQVKTILYQVVESHPNILKNPKPWVRLDGFGEYGYEFMVRGFISSVYTLEKWEIASAIRFAIVKAFDEHDIRLALPTRLLLTRMNRMGEGVGLPPRSE